MALSASIVVCEPGSQLRFQNCHQRSADDSNSPSFFLLTHPIALLFILPVQDDHIVCDPRSWLGRFNCFQGSADGIPQITLMRLYHKYWWKRVEYLNYTSGEPRFHLAADPGFWFGRLEPDS